MAYACGGVPGLRELAKAVAWSPSLSAAVDNAYVQPVGQSQTKDGVTVTVEYVIADQKRANIYYTVKSGPDTELGVDPEVTDPNGEFVSCGSGTPLVEDGGLREFTVDFGEEDDPSGVHLTLSVYDNGPKAADDAKPAPDTSYEDSMFETPDWAPDYLAVFEFDLTFDPYYTAQGEVIPVNREFTLDGQTLTVEEVEVYPTHVRVNIAEAGDENTAWLKGVSFYLENERGQKFEPVRSGVTASGSADSPAMMSYYLESPYFSRSQHLTLHFTGAKWLDKDKERIRVDLDTKTAEWLPEGVVFLKADHRQGGWLVSFKAPVNPGGGFYQLFASRFWDAAGKQYDIMQHGSSSYSYEDPETGMWHFEEGFFEEEFPLKDFHGDTVWLEPIATRSTTEDIPVTVTIK